MNRLCVVAVASSVIGCRPAVPSARNDATCEAPIDAARRMFAAENPGIQPGDAEVTQSLDFNGDGRTDVSVTFPAVGGSGGSEHRMFVLEGACAHYVGKLFGDEIIPEQRDVDRSLVVRVEAYAGSTDWLEQLAKMDSTGTYSIFRVRHCRASFNSQPSEECSAWARAAP